MQHKTADTMVMMPAEGSAWGLSASQSNVLQKNSKHFRTG
jgi:hypothetical protein